jgi:hypothetical protein
MGSSQPGRDLPARLAGGHATADLLTLGHAETAGIAMRWLPLYAAGLEHEGPHRWPALAQPAGDQAQRLPSSPAPPDLVLLCC